ATEKNKIEASKGGRLLKRDTSQPEIGNPMRELTGMVSNRLPSSASLRLKEDLIVGIREAQVEKQTPAKKK
ncbi:hypothetical protein, partial [Autumnicola edwardsiae]